MAQLVTYCPELMSVAPEGAIGNGTQARPSPSTAQPKGAHKHKHAKQKANKRIMHQAKNQKIKQ
jgi:hypothetical protein